MKTTSRKFMTKNGNLINEGSFVKSSLEWDSQKPIKTTRSSLSIVPLEPNVKWRYKTGDDVMSSPSVSGGMVFVGSMITISMR